MVQRGAVVPLVLLLVPLLFSGCTGKDEFIWEYTWTYGPGIENPQHPDTDHPRELEHFRANISGSWKVRVDATITHGSFEVYLVKPSGQTALSVRESGTSSIGGELGIWGVNFLTDSATEDAPVGQIHVKVTGRR